MILRLFRTLALCFPIAFGLVLAGCVPALWEAHTLPDDVFTECPKVKDGCVCLKDDQYDSYLVICQ